MLQPTELPRCTGCRCCAQICPVKAITFEEDDEGFLIPVIDQKTCVDCGLCAQRCPTNKEAALREPVQVLGAKYKLDDKKLFESASGGVCYALGEEFLSGGNAVVFGAALDENNVCRHIGVYSADALAPLQSSKYVQSDIGNTFSEAERALKSGKKVLFTGTPCQIAGLNAYLGKEYDNLYTIDLICHGVPSPALFRLYVQYLEEKAEDGKIIYFNFRSKAKTGWSGVESLAKTKTKTKYIPSSRNEYMISFFQNSALRECCYSCRYTQTARVGDITAGDFWGVKETHPAFFDKRGCSCVLVNTVKGQELAGLLSKSCVLIDARLSDVVQHQGMMRSPAKRPAKRDTLIKDALASGVAAFKKSDFHISFFMRMRQWMAFRMPWLYNAIRWVLKR